MRVYLWLLVWSCFCTAYALRKCIFVSSLSTIHHPELNKLLSSSSSSSSKVGNVMVYIPTAGYAINCTSSKSEGEQRRRFRYDARQKMKTLSELFSFDQIKLLELDSSQSNLEECFRDASAVYVDGGNTFYLQYHMLRSGFWNSLESFLSRGGVYIGCSAGAIVAGETISTAYWKGWDDPLIPAKGSSCGYFEWNKDTLRGRNLWLSSNTSLQPLSYFMHYNAPAHDQLIAQNIHTLGESSKVVTIGDGEAVVCGYESESLRSLLSSKIYSLHSLSPVSSHTSTLYKLSRIYSC